MPGRLRLRPDVMERIPLRCRVLGHRWHHETDPEDGAPVVRCTRCDLREVRPTQVMARIGWPGHPNL